MCGAENLMLIVNPYAGRGLSKQTLGVIVSLLCGEGCAVTVYSTDCGRRNFAGNTAGDTTVVCVGGDGTLSGVTSGLMQIDDPPPFGYIPSGTANDMASTLPCPETPDAVMSVLKGNPSLWTSGASTTHISRISRPSELLQASPTNAQSGQARAGPFRLRHRRAGQHAGDSAAAYGYCLRRRHRRG